jgi:hypothetical protein
MYFYKIYNILVFVFRFNFNLTFKESDCSQLYGPLWLLSILYPEYTPDKSRVKCFLPKDRHKARYF